MAEPLTTDDLVTMEQASRRFSGAYTGTSGTLAGYVILLLNEVRRLKVVEDKWSSHRCLWGNDPSGPWYESES